MFRVATENSKNAAPSNLHSKRIGRKRERERARKKGGKGGEREKRDKYKRERRESERVREDAGVTREVCKTRGSIFLRINGAELPVVLLAVL